MAPLSLLGYVAGALFLGKLILRERTGLVWSFLLGWFILRVVGVLPFAGGLLTLVATIYGLGALLVAAWQLTRSIPALPPAEGADDVNAAASPDEGGDPPSDAAAVAEASSGNGAEQDAGGDGDTDTEADSDTSDTDPSDTDTPGTGLGTPT